MGAHSMHPPYPLGSEEVNLEDIETAVTVVEQTPRVVRTRKLSPATQLKAYHREREHINAFIGNEMIAGTDYGPSKEGGKPTLLKPGAEKFCILMQMEPVFLNDTDTWQMIGSQTGSIRMVCFLMSKATKERAIVLILERGREFELSIYRALARAEGRGAGEMSERRNMTANSLVKITEKRSLVDGVLRIAGLSELFTQDREEGSETDAHDAAYEDATSDAVADQGTRPAPVDSDERVAALATIFTDITEAKEKGAFGPPGTKGASDAANRWYNRASSSTGMDTIKNVAEEVAKLLTNAGGA